MHGSTRYRGGFTLIELLVVIAIIGLLASIVLASLNAARIKARDAARISAMQEMKKALELYYNDHGHYPYSCGGSTYNGGPYPWMSFSVSPMSTNQMCTSANGTTFDGNTFSQEMAPYIGKLVDPRAASTFWGDYQYINTRDANSYCFSDAKAENLNNFPTGMVSAYLCGSWSAATGQCTAPGPGDASQPNGLNGIYIGAGGYVGPGC